MFNESHYRAILDPYKKRFGIENSDLTPGQWLYNRTEIKQMFLEEFLIVDILGAFDEACQKNRWPIGTPFFRRVHDVLLVHRREAKPVIKIDGGLQSIGALIKH